MNPMRIFIASSGNAKPLAKCLQEEMNSLEVELKKNSGKEEKFWMPVPWFDEDSELRKKYGPSILEGLIKECENIDLAVILLTEDDIILSHGSEEKERIPRDNCIFEAGLFMGGLGLERDRCVIVTSVAQMSLPDDLQSVHYIPFDSEAAKDPVSRKKVAETIAFELHLHAQNLTVPPKRPFLNIYTPEELVGREKPKSQGGDIVDTSGLGVVVNTVQPIETKVSLAKRVVNNMEAGIEYYYFFRAEPHRMREVAALIQALVLAKLGESKDLPEDERVSTIQKYARDGLVENAIKQIQKKLFIHFLPIERLPLYFCVHNALQDKLARCYLRYPGEQDFFIPWAEHEAAYAVARDLLELSLPEDRQSIFYATEYFDIYARTKESSTLRKSIKRQLKYKFSDEVYNRILSYFFA